MADQTPTPNPPGNSPQSPNQPAGPPKKSNANKVIIIIVSILVILAILGALGSFLVFRFVKKAADESGIKELNKIAEEIQDYPTAYKSENLPQYPNAQITSLSRKDATVSDGISIVISSNDSSAKVAEFFDTRLKAKGWAADGESMPFDASFYYRNYTKGDQEFSITVQTSTDNNETTATIGWSLAQ